MAKKVLTPEEVKAKMDKKSAKRKLFFGTFTKALAFFLAIAMAYSLAIIAFTPATVSTGSTGSVQGSQQQSGDESQDGGDMFGDSGSASTGDSGSASTGDSGSVSTGDSGSASTGDSGSASTGDSGSASTGGQQSAQLSKADVAKALNEATAKAAKASYKWKRVAEYTKDIAISPSFLTSTLDSIIHAVDENASLNSVVGGFLDMGTREADVVNGAAPEGMKEKYLLKATTLTEADIQSCKVDGNKYMIQVKNTQNPQTGSALDRATNDYITVKEVNDSIASVTTAISVKDSSQLNYSSIAIVATIEDGKLTNMTVSYNFSATLDLSIGASGSGAGKGTAEYSNFKY